MTTITYITRLCKKEFNRDSPSLDFGIQVPRYCPICGMPQCPDVADSKLWKPDGDARYGTVMYTCNNCSRKYLVNYDLSPSAESWKPCSFYPVLDLSCKNDVLDPVSPRFSELYAQALRSEQLGDVDLAATGYRNAIECLIKDYAIVELHADPDTVTKESLFEAIGNYLDPDMVKTADVVRILGNDFTHYQRKYPQFDFKILKTYTAYFISLIERKIRINHPPVQRN